MRVNHIRVLFNNIKSLINHKLTYYSTTLPKCSNSSPLIDFTVNIKHSLFSIAKFMLHTCINNFL